MRPVIGVSTDYDAGGKSYVLGEKYVSSILRAGGLPVMLPPVQDEETIQSYSAICDGLLLSGGEDADPVFWEAWPEKNMGEINPVRDIFEIELTRKIMGMGKAILGICRGCQIINVAAGGSLEQDLGGSFMHRQKAPRNYAFHPVYIQSSSKLGRILACEEIRVNSFHHQAIKIPGHDLKISACAPDGTIEAVEYDGRQLVLGVQWHPECMQDEHAASLFRALVEAAGN